jgi:ATP-dependent RNA circularization protein (DNA/RNA ligase family)
MDEVRMQKLLFGTDEIEEKLDGKTVGTGFLPGYVIYGEYLKYRHSVKYDKLPAWIIGFDVLDLNTGRLLEREEKTKLFQNLGLPCVPLLFKGRIQSPQELTAFLERKSAFSTTEKIEGVVIKNYGAQLFGKIVSYEFITGIEKHWTKQQITLNQLGQKPFASPLAMSTDLWTQA